MITGEAGCGVRYAVLKSGSSVGYCALGIRCGTRDEEGYHGGIAHFTEHTLFKGTKDKSSTTINGCLDRLGGELNAYTTKEEIVLHSTVLKEDLGKAISLLLDLAVNPTFPEEEIAVEKGVVIDEINSYKDCPADAAYDSFEEKLFTSHPLGKPILGTAASVRGITTEELRRFTSEKFRPWNMALTVVSPLEETRMEKMVLRLLGKFFPGTGTPPGLDVFAPKEYHMPVSVPFNVELRRRNHEANAIIGGPAPSLYMEKERLAATLLGNILGGPASNSKLNSILREKNGWVYNVECLYTQYADTGVFAVCLGCDRENVPKCLRTVDKVLSSLQEKPLSERSLKAAKKQLYGQLAISSDNGETQCLSLVKSLLSFGKVVPLEQTLAEVDALTSSDIQEAARSLFAPDRLSTLIYL